MSYDGRAVANFILSESAEQGWAVTNLSLQKIVYFCHVWSLIELGRPLVRHNFEAWQFGPVLPYLYREFSSFEADPITTRAKKLDRATGEMKEAVGEFDPDTRALLVRVVRFYSRLSAGQLVDLSHVAGGPWEIVWNHGGRVNPGMKIENDKIANFYSKVHPPFSVQ